MANNFTDQLELDIADHFFGAGGAAAVGQPTAWTLALYTTDPTETGAAGTEVSATGTAYARQTVSFGAPAANGTAKRISNSAQINFPQATAAWGVVSHFVVFADAKPYVYGPLAATKTIASGDVFQVPAGNLTVDID